MVERPPPKREATGSIPVRRADEAQRWRCGTAPRVPGKETRFPPFDDVAERQGAGKGSQPRCIAVGNPRNSRSRWFDSSRRLVAVAQLERASGCESGSCEFKSHRSPLANGIYGFSGGRASRRAAFAAKTPARQEPRPPFGISMQSP